jgi:hypothetical protein
MKGDFSRINFLPGRNYDRVLMQQGRLQTDADWNEQGAIVARQHRRAVADIVGPAAAPRDCAGFGIRAHGGSAFDGEGSRFEIEAPEPRPIGGAFTIEGWVKVAAARRSTIVGCLSSEDDPAGGFRLGLSAAGRLHFERVEEREVEIIEREVEAWPEGDFELFEVIEGEERVTRRVFGRDPLACDRYVHIAAVCGADGIQLFQDGERTAHAPAGAGVAFDTSGFVIGCDLIDGEPQNAFMGAIDRLRLWGEALDAAAVRRIAAEPEDAPAARPVCDWRFGAPGRGVEDFSGSGHHARPVEEDAQDLPPPAEPEVWIGAGAYYIEGARCELEGAVRFDQQPSHPGARLPDPRGGQTQMFYLESWDRAVSAAEDEALRDPALGGLDTTARSQIVSQVRVVEARAFEALAARAKRTGALKIARTADADLARNRLIRIEIHDEGFAAGIEHSPGRAVADGLEIADLGRDGAVTLAERQDRLWRPGRPVELARPGLRHAIPGIVTSAGRDDEDRPVLQVTFDPGAEIGGDPEGWRLRPLATFKVSLDNAAWLFPVSDLDAAQTVVTVRDDLRRLGLLAPEAWAEIVDRTSTFERLPGALAPIHAIEADDLGGLAVDLGAPAIDPQGRSLEARLADVPMLRCWDPILTAAGAVGACAFTADKPVRVPAAGIEVTFGPGYYRSGDDWTTAARDELDWPTGADGAPLWAPPHGGPPRLAPLALMRFRGGMVEVRDQRRIFPPLADLSDEPDRIAELEEELDEVIDEVIEIEAELDDLIEEVSELDGGDLLRGQCVFTLSRRSEPGWRFDGTRISLPREAPEWSGQEADAPIDPPHAATELDGLVFALDAHNQFCSWDPVSGLWERRRGIDHADLRIEGLAGLGGRVHALGWRRDDGASIHLAYDPEADDWREGPPTPTPRRRFGMAVLNGRLFVAGGSARREAGLLDAVESYSLQSGAWESHAPLPEPMAGCALVGAQGRLHLAGGLVPYIFGLALRPTARVWTYSPASDQWREGPPLLHARSGANLATTGKLLHVIGGAGPDGEAVHNEMFDLATGARLEAPQPLLRLHGPPTIAAVDGVLYRFGQTAGDTALLSDSCAFEQVLYTHSRTC